MALAWPYSVGLKAGSETIMARKSPEDQKRDATLAKMLATRPTPKKWCQNPEGVNQCPEGERRVAARKPPPAPTQTSKLSWNGAYLSFFGPVLIVSTTEVSFSSWASGTV